MFENKSRTEISDLGEFGLINHLSAGFTNVQSSTVLGIGDDAAVIDISGDDYILVSTDAMHENVHFDLTFHPLKHLGYKAVTSTISDICAMNGTPTQIFIALGISNRFSLEAVEEFYAGVQAACEKYKVDLAGGDTTATPKGLSVSVTAIGTVKKDRLCKRSGVAENDLLVVSGDLGGAYMGLQLLEREKRVFLEHPGMQPDLDGYEYILSRQLRPECRTDIIEILNELNVLPTAMIDISDGLASEIHHLGLKSGCGFTVYDEKLPIDPQVIQLATDFSLNPSVVALNGGEDYELLFTISQSDYDKIKHLPDFSVIGFATAKSGKHDLIGKSGASFEIKAQGWEHFSS